MNKEILKNINVLYVEDEQDVRDFTSKTISSIVKNVIVASNGKEGLEKYNLNPEINLILTDINMPKMGGLEMCNKIRETNNDIPIVITSAHSDPEFLKKAIDVKVSAYAMKPIDLYQLIESMIKAVEPIFLRKELEEINLSLTNKVEEAIKKTKLLLDSQDNMVFITNLTKIIEVNRKFLYYFDVESLDDFFDKKESLLSQLKVENGFFSADTISSKDAWISGILQLKEIDRVVKIKNKNGEYRNFTINIDDYEHKGEHYVISLTDITELKEKSNLLEYQTTHDQITGLFNKEKFNEIFSKEIKRDKRYNNALSLIVFNVDNFKKFNTDFGQDMGDDILSIISEIILRNIREHDTAARWDKEYFIVLLPQTELKGAVNVSEKIRSAIEDITIKNSLSKITASFGVTKLHKEDTEQEFINKGKKALSIAKEKGKNIVISN